MYLDPGGWLLLEIGSDQAAAIVALMGENYREIEVYRDLNGLDRAVAGRI